LFLLLLLVPVISEFSEKLLRPKEVCQRRLVEGFKKQVKEVEESA